MKVIRPSTVRMELAWKLTGIVFLLYLVLSIFDPLGEWSPLLAGFTSLMVLISIVLTIADLIYKQSHYLKIGEDGTIVWHEGIVGKEEIRLKRQDIRTIKVKQGLLGRIFGYGHVFIATSGTDDYEIKAYRLKKPFIVEALIKGEDLSE